MKMSDKVIFHCKCIIVVLIELAWAVPVYEEVKSTLQINDDMENSILNHHVVFTPVSRKDWGARPPVSVTPLRTPVPYVVIHHTYIPRACNTTVGCSASMRGMQRAHQRDNGWADIGYNFCVGGDGQAYVGRGWTTLGAHSLHFNSVSIGVCLIGDWTDELPPISQINMTHTAIEFGVEHGYIAKDYKLVGHRQVRSNTTCPGDALFQNIKTWPHFSAHPAGPEYLHEVLEQIQKQSDS